MNSARDIWVDLEQRYDRGNGYRLSDLLEDFHSKRQGSLTIDEYHTKLKILCDEILMLTNIPTCICNPEPPCTVR